MASWWKLGKSVLNEADENEHQSIGRTVRIFNLSVELKLASVFLQTLTITKGEQQQRDKELRGCLFSWCEKILKGNETILVSDSFGMSSVRHTIFFFFERRNYPHEALSSCCCSLLVSINVIEHTVKVSILSLSQNQICFDPLHRLMLMFRRFIKEY